MAPNENPYQPSFVSSSDGSIMRTKRNRILFGVGVLSLLSAALIYLLAERWTFYTPYSVETSWLYIVPGGSSFTMSSWIALLAMLGLVVFGIGLMIAPFLLSQVKNPPKNESTS